MWIYPIVAREPSIQRADIPLSHKDTNRLSVVNGRTSGLLFRAWLVVTGDVQVFKYGQCGSQEDRRMECIDNDRVWITRISGFVYLPGQTGG